MSELDELRANGHNGNGALVGRQLMLTTIALVQPESVRWLWRGRIVLGMLNLTAGEPGLGKSTLTYYLAAEVSRGDLDGDLYTHPADVLIVTYEDHIASVVRPRLEAAGADLERVHVLGVKEDDTEALLTFPGDLELIRQAIERTNARLLVVDPIVASLPSEINSHRDQDVRRVLAPLAQLAERYDTAVDVVMHVNKSQAKHFFQRVGGSIGFTGAVRSALLVARDPADPDGERGPRRVLAHGKCNVGPEMASLLLEIERVQLTEEIETSRLRFLGECEASTTELLGAADEDQRTELDEACDWLAGELEGGKRKSEEVSRGARAVGISEPTLRRARKRLKVRSTREGFGEQGVWYVQLPEGDEDPLPHRCSPKRLWAEDDGSHRRSNPETPDRVSAYGEMPSLQGETPSHTDPGGHRRSIPGGERLCSEETLVQAIKNMLGAEELDDGKWADYARTHDIVDLVGNDA